MASKKKKKSFSEQVISGTYESSLSRENVAPSLSKTNKSVTKANSKKESFTDGSTFSAFEDGYNFGDVTKTILKGGAKLGKTVFDTGKEIVTNPIESIKTGAVGIASGIDKADTLVNNAVDDFFDWVVPGRKEKDKGMTLKEFNQLSSATDEKTKNKILKEYEEKYGKDSSTYKTIELQLETDKKDKNILNWKYTDSEVYEKAQAGELSEGQENIYGVGENIGQMLPAMGVSMVAGPMAGTGVFFVQSQQSYTEEALARGYDEKDARTYGVIMGGTEVLVERLGFDELGGLNKLSNASVKKAMVGEGLEEFVMPYVDDVVTYGLYEDGYSWEEFGESTEEAVEGAVMGATVGAIMNAGGRGLQKVDNVINKINTGQEITQEDLVEAGKELQENAPELLEEAMRGVPEVVRQELEKQKANQVTTEEVAIADESINVLPQEEQDDIAPVVENVVQQAGQQDIAPVEMPQQEVQQETQPVSEKELKTRNYTYVASETDSQITRDLKESASRVMNDTKRSHEFVETVSKIAERTQTKYKFTNTEEINALGYGVEGKVVNGLVTKDGEILINIDSQRALNTIIGHETTHLLEGTKEYQALQDAVFKYAQTKGDFAEISERMKRIYAGQKNANINNEITSELIGDYLFTDQQFLDSLTAEQPSVARRIYNEIKHWIKMATSGSKEARMLEDLKHKFEKALNSKPDATKKAAVNKTKQATTKETKDNSVVEAESNTKGKEKYSLISDEAKKTTVQKLNKKVAQGMKKLGYSEQQIWLATGYQFNNGKWQTEITDAKIKEGFKFEKGKEYKLSEVVDAKELFRAYPQLKDVTISKIDMETLAEGPKELVVAKKLLGATTKEGNILLSDKIVYKKAANEVLNHEIQHLIQEIEGFDTNTGSYLTKDSNGEYVSKESLQEYFDDISEKEARQVQNRTKMTAEERKNTLPKETTTKVDMDKIVKKDKQGRFLSKEQIKFFKDSKVRDENGNLLVMYHGTSSGGYTVFDPYGGRPGLFGQGSYFTDNKSVAESYTEKGRGNNKQIYEVYLNITNPIDMDAQANVEEWKQYFSKHIPDATFSESGTNEALYRSTLEEFENSEYDRYEVAEIMIETFQKMGYDGITHIGGGRFNQKDDTRHRVYITFDSNQVKNVDNTTPTENEDIRYSLSEDNKGYHYGDLGKARDTNYFSMSNTRRSTGHFGNGTYFVGSKDSNVGSLKEGRSVHEVDFTDYNLFKPKNSMEAERLHRLLKDINNEELNAFELEDAERLFNKSYEELYESYKNTTVKAEEYKKLDDFTQLETDSLSTIFMKELGYNGIDVRGIEGFDNGTYGSVIYDLDNKTSDVKYSLDDVEFEKIESNTKDVTDEKTGYENVPNNLMGFSNSRANQKGFNEEQYHYVLDAYISVDGGKTFFEDSIKGMNYKHALERLKRDRPGGIFRVVKEGAIPTQWELEHLEETRQSGNVGEYNFESERVKNKYDKNKYSLTDNQGRELSKEQQEFFKDSKVRDENGNLLTYYNGSGDFTVYDKNKMSDMSKWGKGIYLTKYEDIAHMYGGNVKELYVNITNPISQNEKTISFKQYNDLYKSINDGENGYREEYDMYDNDLDLLWDMTNNGSWADFSEQIKEYTGKDGLIINDDTKAEDMAIAFNSNQVKNVDNANPTSDADIRYSLSEETDNQGRKLTEYTLEKTKNSKVRDDNGNLMLMYHGSPDGTYDQLRAGTYFTSNKEYADGYQWEGASSISYGKQVNNPRTYEAYLNITNPFTLKNEIAKNIYLNEYIKGGNSAYFDPYTDYTDTINNMDEIDWVEGVDLQEWLQENHPEFDGMFLDEGGDGGYGGAEYRWRGYSAVPFSEEQIIKANNNNTEYSLSNLDEDIAPVGNYNVYGSEVGLQQQVEEAIAPLQEKVEELTKVITDLQENIAPASFETAEEQRAETQRTLGEGEAPLTEEGTFNFLDEAPIEVKNKRDITYDIQNAFNIKHTEAREIYNKIASMPELSVEDIYAELENYKQVKVQEQDDYYKDIQNHIKGTKLNVSEIKNQITDYDNTYRMANMGKGLILANSGDSIDSFYQELNELYPNVFPDTVTAEADQLDLISQVMFRDTNLTYTETIDDDTLQILSEKLYSEIGNRERYKSAEAHQTNWFRHYKDMLAPGEEAPIKTDITQEEYLKSLPDALEDDYAPYLEMAREVNASNTEQTSEMASIMEELNRLDTEKAKEVKEAENEPKIAKNVYEELMENFIRRNKTKKTPVQSGEKSKLRNAIDTGKRLFVNEMAETDNLAKETGNMDIKYKGDMLNAVAGEIEGEIYAAQTNNEGKAIGDSLSGLFAEAKKTGLYEPFNHYLELQSNIDRHKQGKGSKVSLAESEQLVKSYEKQHPQFKEWGKGVWNYGENILNNLEDAGLVSRQTVKNLREMYPHYVPYIENRDVSNYYPDLGEIKSTSVIKRAKGGASNLLPIEDALTKYTFASKKAVRQNQFYQELVSTLDDKASIGADVRSDATDLDTSLYRDETGNYLTAYFGGQQQSVRISDDLYSGLKNDLSHQIKALEDKFSIITDPIQKISEVRRNLLTSWNPMFIIRNPIMDVQDAVFNSKHTKDFVKNYPSSFLELSRAKSDTAKQFLTLYGSGNVMGEHSTDGTVKNGKFLKGIQKINNIVELAPRYAEFKASLENGASVQEAMYNAREVTTNFSRGGTITKALNKNGFTFLNVSVQGFDKFIRNFSGENGAKGIANSLLKASIFGVLPAVFNELAFGGEDEDEEYEALPDYIKDNYYLIKTDDGKFIRIPKGRILSVFGSAGRRTLEYMQGEEDAFEGFLKNTNSQVGVPNPLDSNILTPLFQAFGSENGEAWYGGDIVPARLQDKAPEEQYDASIDKFSIWLGDKTGVSPYKINYVLDQYSGGMGDIFLPMITDEATNDVEGPGVVLAPIKDAFTANSTFDNKYASEIYTLSDKMDKMPTATKETDEYKIQDAYLYSVTSEMAELYAERREVQADKTLSKNEKYEKVKAIQDQINSLAKEGLDYYQYVSKTDNYAIVGGREFNKYTTDSGEERWGKVFDDVLDDMNSMGMDLEEKSEYFKATSTISATQESYKGSDDYVGKKRDVISIIKDTNLNDEQKAYLYDKYYGNTEVINAMVTLGVDMDSFLDYESQNFEADKYANGKTISGSKKAKVFSYINSMDIGFEQRVILAKLQYNSYDEYNAEIIEYLNESDLTYEEEVVFLEKLGFIVDENGNIYW